MLNTLISHAPRVSIVQELCESRSGRPGLSVLTSLMVSVDVKQYCSGIGPRLSLVCQPTSEDIKQHQKKKKCPYSVGVDRRSFIVSSSLLSQTSRQMLSARCVVRRSIQSTC